VQSRAVSLVAPPELLAAIEALERSTDTIFLDVQKRKVLFRADGLIVAVSDLVYDLFVTLRGVPPDERIASLVRRHGASEVSKAFQAFAEMCGVGLFAGPVSELPRKRPADVQPSGIVLMVAQTCNLACTYCYGGGGSYGSQVARMDPATARAAIDLMIDRAPARDKYTVIFFGGEPLLNFRLIRETVGYCEARAQELGKSFSHSMTTNGTVLTDAILDFLREKRFTLMVSLDGPQAVQDSLRPFVTGRGSFAVVIHNIRRLTEAGVPVQMRATLTRKTLSAEAIHEVVRIGRELGCNRVVMSPVDTTKSEGKVDEALQLGSEQLMELERIYEAITEENLEHARVGDTARAGYDPHVRMMRSLAQGKGRGLTQCGACFGMAATSSDGTLFPCHRFVGMDAYAIGDLASGFDLARIEEFFARAERAYTAKCNECWARQICCGLCYFRTADGDGGFAEPDDGACGSFRASLENAVGFLARLRELPEDEQRRYVESVRFV